jgi:hypothetical protein
MSTVFHSPYREQREQSAEKKGDKGNCLERIVGLSPYCDVPSSTLPRIVL